MIVGVGIDLVTVPRIERLIARYGERFVAKVFTPDERRYCEGYAQPALHYAARFAAKEALLKVLGVPPGLRWHELEVHSEDGRPLARLHGTAAQAARAMGVARVLISLTHEGTTAAAVAVAEGA